MLEPADYWAGKARQTLNLSIEEAKALCEYAERFSIAEFVNRYRERRQLSEGVEAVSVFDAKDIGNLNRLYSVNADKLKFFNMDIAQMAEELELVP